MKQEDKMSKTKLVPFDIERAKNGAKVVTRKGLPAKIVDYPIKNEIYPILGLILVDGKEFPLLFTKTGNQYKNCTESRYDLFIEEEGVESQKNSLNLKSKKNKKPINNIKPKFKVGDYIVNDSVNMRGKIVKLTDHSYQFSSGKCIPFEDNRTRLWEVAKDAKPGDVLASEYWDDILIFKQIDDRVGFSSYYNINQKRNNSWVSNYFQPATKKQRKQLFQKMKEEGYKWDPVKKELKKIENEAVTKTETRSSWTLLDAKPGDVLASKDGYDILIFKEINNSMSFSSYYNILQKPNKNWVKNNELFQPATKEQCDFLFRRMKEAGYQWDKEKKELKKIKVGNVKKGVKKRRMTNQELSWWLRDCPEEHREYSIKGVYHIHSSHDYFNGDDFSNNADRKVDNDILIRRNGGEWEEPLIEE